MIVRNVLPNEKDKYNSVVSHPVQSWEWGEFRMAMGVEVIRLGLFEGNTLREAISATLHPVPRKIPIISGWSVMYIPRCTGISDQMMAGINKICKEKNVIYAKIEPDIFSVKKSEEYLDSWWEWNKQQNLVKGSPSFATYSAYIDLNLNDEELFAHMKQKTRYNTLLAMRKGVVVEVDNSDIAFERYLDLTEETTKRQGFYAHTREYHRQMWRHLYPGGIAKLLCAKYEGKIISTWILFKWGNRLFYPYGASTREHAYLMANNLMMWKAIQLGKEEKLDKFDLWGTLGPEAREDDPWYGFHKFKLGFGPVEIKYIDSHDLVMNKLRYKLFNMANRQRKNIMKIKARIKSKISGLK